MKVRVICTRGHYLEEEDYKQIEELMQRILDIGKREKPLPGPIGLERVEWEGGRQ